MPAPEAGAALPCQVDFYLLPSAQPLDALDFTCKLLDKAWRLGHRAWVVCATAEQCQALDERLWRFRAEAFVPHAPQADDPHAPVVLATGVPATEARGHALHDLLVNLAEGLPQGHEGFARVAEIVPDEPALRQAARERFRFYRERGYALQNHRLSRI